jgi:hypothetical protein
MHVIYLFIYLFIHVFGHITQQMDYPVTGFYPVVALLQPCTHDNTYNYLPCLDVTVISNGKSGSGY